MIFKKKSLVISGRTLLGEEPDIPERLRKIPIYLLRFVATLIGCILVPGLTGGLLPGLEASTSNIFYVAFGAVATLSSLCFRMSSGLQDKDCHKSEMAYAGERFLHASLLFLTGAVFKYVALTTRQLKIPADFDVTAISDFFASITSNVGWLESHNWVQTALSIDITLFIAYGFNWLTVMMYWWAVDTAYTGVNITHDVMWARFHRFR